MTIDEELTISCFWRNMASGLRSADEAVCHFTSLQRGFEWDRKAAVRWGTFIPRPLK